MVTFTTPVVGTSPRKLEPFRPAPAARLGPDERKDLALHVLARDRPVTHLAAEMGVSRRFAYRQAAKANDALDAAFDPSVEDDTILFQLPVTKKRIRSAVVSLALHCHSAYRGIIEFLRDMLDTPISIGTVHNILRAAAARAREVNAADDLSRIRVGAHDEIFQAGKPVLVGADVRSTYCYLPAPEDHRDETTWGVHLLDLAGRGLRPQYSIADGGKGLRAGQRAAWPGVPCRGDVFHPLRELGQLAGYLENRASGLNTALQRLQRKMERAKNKGRGNTLSKKLAVACEEEAKAAELARDVRTLSDWMRNDILSLAGPDLDARRELFDFVVEELRTREPLCPHRIRPVRRSPRNQRDDLLAFVGVLDGKLADVARRFDVPPHLVRAVCELHGLDKKQSRYWQREAELRGKLRGTFHDLEAAVLDAMADAPRASSIIENLNSRLRTCFFLRRHLGDEYLDLLRFFLNHHRFMRSDRDERVGESPAELLTGEKRPHWLELPGFETFHRN
jgi:hypothetical protein